MPSRDVSARVLVRALTRAVSEDDLRQAVLDEPLVRKDERGRIIEEVTIVEDRETNTTTTIGGSR